MLAVSFFGLIFSSLLWLIFSVRFIAESLAGIAFFDAGVANILLYTLLVFAPIFVTWGVFGQINQYINNRNVSIQLRRVMGQLKKNQDYSDLLARILIESEGHLKDGFVLSKFDLLIADMNELLSEVIRNCKIASPEQIENLWSRVQNGGKWAFGKVIIEVNNAQPNFKKKVFEKAAYDNILGGSVMEFCARYVAVVKMLEKHDSDKVFLNMVENGVMGKVFSILAPISDKLQRGREAVQSFEVEELVTEEFKPEPQRVREPLRVSRPQPEEDLSQKKSFFSKFKREKEEITEVRFAEPQRDPFSLALEKSFGDEPQISEPEDIMPAPRLAPSILPEEPSFTSSPFDEPEALLSDTQRTLDSLKKEWDEVQAPSVTAPSFDPQPKLKEEDSLAYPFGSWTDEKNYQR